MRTVAVIAILLMYMAASAGAEELHSTKTKVKFQPGDVVVGQGSLVTVTVQDMMTEQDDVTDQDKDAHNVKSNPSGVVTFSSSVISDEFTPLTCTLTPQEKGNSGKSTCNVTVTSAAAGSNLITASYGGSATHLTSSDTKTLRVTKSSTTTLITSVEPDSSVINTPVVVLYSVSVVSPGSGTPTGNVKVRVIGDISATCMGTVADGTCSLTPTIVGEKTLEAHYEGDDNFLESYGTTSHAISPIPELSPLVLTSAGILGIILISRRYTK
jgi:hypothetical protein